MWLGAFAGFFICLVLGGAFIGAFYSLGKDVWSGSEDLWEGVFCLIASIIITVSNCCLPFTSNPPANHTCNYAQIMGAAILRLSKLQSKWSVKIAAALEAEKTKGLGAKARKYAMVILPFITVLREGLEAVVFVGGVSLSEPPSAFPIPVIAGLVAGATVGWIIYKGGNTIRIQWFLIASTMVLYLVAAGLFSRAVWGFETWKVILTHFCSLTLFY